MASKRVERMLDLVSTRSSGSIAQAKVEQESMILQGAEVVRRSNASAAVIGIGVGASAWTAVQLSRVLSSDWFWEDVVPKVADIYQHWDAITLAADVVDVAEGLGLDVVDVAGMAISNFDLVWDIAEVAVDGIDVVEAATTLGLSVAVSWATGKIVDSYYASENEANENTLRTYAELCTARRKLQAALVNSLPTHRVRELISDVHPQTLVL